MPKSAYRATPERLTPKGDHSPYLQTRLLGFADKPLGYDWEDQMNRLLDETLRHIVYEIQFNPREYYSERAAR